jgi:hypothetical protein
VSDATPVTDRSETALSWAERPEGACLRVDDWAALPFGAMTLAELGHRFAVLASSVLEDLGGESRLPSLASLTSLTSLPGTFERDGAALLFIPRFPFVDGTTYVAFVDQIRIGTIRRPAKAGLAGTRVAAIYPSGPSLPVNLLKFYVQFSSPMSEGWALRAIEVRRADSGEVLRDVFLNTSHELWDAAHMRLTLLLDPGRIKRGLAPHVESGYPLVEHMPIALVVSEIFRDADGLPLCEGAERHYEVGPVLGARVNPQQWQYRFPRRGSREAFEVTFDRPLDYALLRHFLSMHDHAGDALSGRAVVGEGERSWHFEPHKAWGAGRYFLAVDPRLEDLAGNSLRRVLDRDVTNPDDDPREYASEAAVEFVCEP